MNASSQVEAYGQGSSGKNRSLKSSSARSLLKR
jgi:hypothetical protein